MNTSVIRKLLGGTLFFCLACSHSPEPMSVKQSSVTLARYFADQCFTQFTFGNAPVSKVQQVWRNYKVRIYYFPPERMYNGKQLQNINPGSFSCSLETNSENKLNNINIWPFTSEVLQYLKPVFKDYSGHKGPSYHPRPFIGSGKGAFYYDADGSSLRYIWQRRTTSKHQHEIETSSAIRFEMILYPHETGNPASIIKNRRHEKDYEKRLEFLKLREKRIWFHERNRFISKKLRAFVENNTQRGTENFLIWTKKYIARTGKEKFARRFSLKKSPVRDICHHFNGYWYYQTYKCDFSVYNNP